MLLASNKCPYQMISHENHPSLPKSFLLEDPAKHGVNGKFFKVLLTIITMSINK